MRRLTSSTDVELVFVNRAIIFTFEHGRDVQDGRVVSIRFLVLELRRCGIPDCRCGCLLLFLADICLEELEERIQVACKRENDKSCIEV